jgi:hypothetical protein
MCSIKNFIYTSVALFAFCSAIISCDRIYADYLQESYAINSPKQQNIKKQIRAYADSVNAILPFSKVEKSMVYSIDHYSFQVTKYLYKGKPVLYVEKGQSNDNTLLTRMYYVENSKPILVREKKIRGNGINQYRLSNTYFKNDNVIGLEQKSGINEIEVSHLPFQVADVKSAPKILPVRVMEDALAQHGEFDLVFEDIIECPKARYLILSRNNVSAYRVPVKVEREDDFIHAVSAEPHRFKGEKLDLSWSLSKQNEMIYLAGRLRKD